MKKRLILFSVSFIITIIIGYCIISALTSETEYAEEYSSNSFITIENQKGAITASSFDLSDCLNKEGKFELKISAGAGDERKARYEISFLVGYEQIPFMMANKECKSFKFDNKADMTIQINKKYFDMKNNSFIVLLREDIERYAESSNLIRNAEPLIMRYIVKRIEGKTKQKKDVSVDITDDIVDNEEEIIHLENSRGNEVTSCHVQSAGEMNLGALLGTTMETGEYMVFACFDSIQTKLNGNKKIYVNKNKDGRLNLKVLVPAKKGKYELQIFFVPAPYDVIHDKNFDDYSVLASQRQTVYVE